MCRRIQPSRWSSIPLGGLVYRGNVRCIAGHHNTRHRYISCTEQVVGVSKRQTNKSWIFDICTAVCKVSPHHTQYLAGVITCLDDGYPATSALLHVYPTTERVAYGDRHELRIMQYTGEQHGNTYCWRCITATAVVTWCTIRHRVWVSAACTCVTCDFLVTQAFSSSRTTASA